MNGEVKQMVLNKKLHLSIISYTHQHLFSIAKLITTSYDVFPPRDGVKKGGIYLGFSYKFAIHIPIQLSSHDRGYSL
jgi:hypothetical protein